MDGVNKMYLSKMFAVAHEDFMEQKTNQSEASFEFCQDRRNVHRPINKWEAERL